MVRKFGLIGFIVLTFVALTSVIGAQPAVADHHMTKVGSLHISNAWTRQTPPGAKTAGGYVTIKNTGSSPDRLIGGSSTVSKSVEIHNMTMDNGIMKMFPLIDGLVIPAGETVTLKPGGLHLMFMGLGAQINKGDMVDVTLEFEKAGAVSLQLPAAKIGAKEHDGHTHHHKH